MNISQKYSSIGRQNDCKNFFNSVPFRFSSVDSFYGLLIATAVLNLAACPFTIFLNALVMVAVKIKRRLQTHPNILLACLALTDLMVGLVVQPLHITKTIFLLHGKHFDEFCDIDLAFTFSLVISCWSSVSHLVLISGERYLAIKHTFTHASVITKVRVMFCSALAWIAAALFLLMLSYSRVMAFALQVITLSSIALFQILVYKEARRHEKRILSEQVSVETRAKFKREKKALKLTTIMLATIVMFFFIPFVSLFVTWHVLGEKLPPDVKTAVHHLALVSVIINSVVNPVIYSAKKRQFRIAFIELLLRKSLREAKEFDRRMFGSWNNAVSPQIHDWTRRPRPGTECRENENASHFDDIHENNRTVCVSYDKNTAFATPKQLTALFHQMYSAAHYKEKAEEQEAGRNARIDEKEEDDNP